MSAKNKLWIRILILAIAFPIFCDCLDTSSSNLPANTEKTPFNNDEELAVEIPSKKHTAAKSKEKDSTSKMKRHTLIEKPSIETTSSTGLNHKIGPNELSYSNLDKQKLKYSQYHIKPTEAFAGPDENTRAIKRVRASKDLNSNDSPLARDIPLASSDTISVVPTASISFHGRQNPNPDIQDIITGIVKLLNGNVNVHANTQGSHRRPTSSRINNRGPPRISDVQTLPLDYDIQKPIGPSSIRPPPYHFDGIEKPFLTGVPIPEQIVPYRPGFVSNRPPWHRNRLRPPINTSSGGRRPIPQYKPIATHNEPLMPLEHSESSETSIEKLEHHLINEDNETTEVSPTATMANELWHEESAPTKDQNQLSESNSTPPLTDFEDTSIATETKPSNASTENPGVIAGSQNEPETPKPASPSPPLSTKHIATPVSYEDLINVPSEDIIFMTTSSFKKTPSLDVTKTTSTTTLNINTKPSELGTVETSVLEDIQATSVETIQGTTTKASQEASYQPRPGIVLDDPEFKPGHGRKPVGRPHQTTHIQPTRQQLPPGYGEIFDVTLSAIQGPGASGSQQTVKIKPYGYDGQIEKVGNADIIVSPSGDDGFVSIDGKRTYINLFGDPTDPPNPPPSAVSPSIQQTVTTQISNQTIQEHKVNDVPLPIGTGVGYAVPETEVVKVNPSKTHSNPVVTNRTPSKRPPYRPRNTQPPVRIDTCIVGDDSTCDQAQHERCKTENGVSSCHCRPGYSRRKHREPCRKVVSFFMALRVDRFYEHKIVWDNKLLDKDSEVFNQLSYESGRAIDSAMSMTPYSDEFMEVKVNNIYKGGPNLEQTGVFVNLTLKIEENAETLRSNFRSDVQKHLLGVLHRRNNNIGNSVLYVESPQGAISNVQDLDECQSQELNDCHANSQCTNIWGSFRCTCNSGFRDPWMDQFQRAGRECQSCPDTYCNNHGTCSYNGDGSQVCQCDTSHYGGQCEIDGEVLGVAIGASVAAIIIIVLTLICLIMWSKRWQREQKNVIGSPVFGYMNTAPLKSGGMLQPGYQVTLEDRMRWAQIADVMAQANHYAAEPIAPTRPSSAMFGYPNLMPMGLGSMAGSVSHMGSTLQMHQNGTLPPVPLPRLGMGSRSSGMRTLENSSSSDEEDRTDLLGRNFQVPRPKSRSNNSVANQSGIYYDVDYELSRNGNNGNNNSGYGGPIQSHPSTTASGQQNIPMSTYTSGRTPSCFYLK